MGLERGSEHLALGPHLSHRVGYLVDEETQASE